MKDDTNFSDVNADGFVAHPVVYYAALYPHLRQVAFEHGYALALHGSLASDLDLLAVPWTETASGPDALVIALAQRAGGMVTVSGLVKPHGRRAWVIMFGTNGGYIDLSVMPLLAHAQVSDADVEAAVERAVADPEPAPPKSGGVL